MIDAHIRSGAGLTVAGIRVPRSQSERFGVIEQRPDGRISRFREKLTSEKLADRVKRMQLDFDKATSLDVVPETSGTQGDLFG